MISIIAAVDKNFLMGRGNKLPWNLPADLKHFKEITNEGTVIMGSKTYFSLPGKFRPLPGRKNIVLSRSKNLNLDDGVILINNISELENITDREKENFIIGGAQVYRLFLEKGLVDRIYLTEIDGEFQGDVYFPEEFLKSFREVDRKKRQADEKNKFFMDFVIYEKMKNEDF